VRKIPDSWETIPLGEVIQTRKGIKPRGLGSKSEVCKIPYITIKAFEKGIIDKYAPEQEATECKVDDILLVWDGARSGLSGRGMSGYVGSTIARVRSDLANADYLYYFIDSCYSSLNTQTKGVGIPHVNPTVLNQFEFPLPPLNEQIRIVEKLEELFADLDHGVVELKQAQIKLGQYRQALLKSAVDGLLTESWRAAHGSANVAGGQEPVATEEHADKISETGEQLLQRILKERRERWEEQKLADFEAKGKKPPKDWQKKYPEPVQPDTSDLPNLPDGWMWATLDQLSAYITSGSRGWAKYYSDSGAVFIRAQNIKTDDIDLNDIAYVDLPNKSEGKRTLVSVNDILLTITGANVGKCAFVRENLSEAYVSQHVALLRMVNVDLARFVHMCLVNPASARGYLTKQAYGAGKPGLNLEQVTSTCIPLPNLSEIAAIIQCLASEDSKNTAKAQSLEAAVKLSKLQRKNILKAAFAGELVQQDPNDEPASALLERIRSQKMERGKPKRSQRRKVRA
jgi:type I restriction enzyme S subunit